MLDWIWKLLFQRERRKGPRDSRYAEDYEPLRDAAPGEKAYCYTGPVYQWDLSEQEQRKRGLLYLLLPLLLLLCAIFPGFFSSLISYSPMVEISFCACCALSLLTLLAAYPAAKLGFLLERWDKERILPRLKNLTQILATLSFLELSCCIVEFIRFPSLAHAPTNIAYPLCAALTAAVSLLFLRLQKRCSARLHMQ